MLPAEHRKSARWFFVAGLLSGLAAAIMGLVIAIHSAPLVRDANKVSDAIVAALGPALAQLPPGERRATFVKTRMSSQVMERLHRAYPALNLLPWEQRPPDAGCLPSHSGTTPVAPCMRPDFVVADVAAFPLWRCAVVVVATSNSTGQITVVNIAGRWRVLAEASLVI